MSKIIDWFRLSDKEYCQKYSHKWYVDNFKYYERGGFRSVATKYTVKQVCCSRCGERKAEHQIDRKLIQSLSMPESMWDEMRKNGRVIL